MRILVIGGVARSLVNFRRSMIEGLVSLGHDVHAAAGEHDSAVYEQLCSMGVKYHSLDLDRRGVSVLSDWRYFRQICKLLDSLCPDVLVSYTIKPVVYAGMAARRYRLKCNAAMITGLGEISSSVEGVRFRERVVSRVACLLYRASLRQADVVFFQNRDDEQFLRRIGAINGQRVVQLPGSGVDLTRFSSSLPPIKPVVFCMIARLLIKKGVRDFAQAAVIVRKLYPDVKFVLVGPVEQGAGGVSHAELDDWVDAGVLEYVGAVQDVRPVLKAASVFVLPSYYGEGQPRTVLEAMASGRAVITTDSTGCRETIAPEKNGFLVPPNSPDDLANAMLAFIRNPELIQCFGAAGRERAESVYDVNIVNRLIFSSIGVA